MQGMARINQSIGYTQAVLSCATGGVLAATCGGAFGSLCIIIGATLALAEWFGKHATAGTPLPQGALSPLLAALLPRVVHGPSLNIYACIGAAFSGMGLFSACLMPLMAKESAVLALGAALASVGCGYVSRCPQQWQRIPSVLTMLSLIVSLYNILFCALVGRLVSARLALVA